MGNNFLKRSTLIEVSAVRVFVIISQLLFLKIYTEITATKELGIYYFLLTASYSLNALFLVPLDYFQQSQIYKLKEDNFSLKSFLSINYFVLKIISILLVTGISLSLIIKPEYWFTIVLMIMFALFTYFGNLLRGIVNNLEHRRKAIYCLLFEYVMKIGCFFFYTQFFNSSAIIILLSLLTASILSFIVLVFVTSKMVEFHLEKKKKYKFNDVLKFSYPISISAAINWVQLQAYSLVLVPLGLADVVGIYATVANVGTGGMNAYSTIFSQLFVPNIYKTNGSYIKIYLRNAVVSIIFILLVSAILSRFIIGLLTTKEFVKYSIVILYGVGCEAANFLIGAITIFLTLHHLTKATLKVSIIGLCGFLISFLCLYLFGQINVFTIGIPMIFTQIVILTGLYFTARTYKLSKSNAITN